MTDCVDKIHAATGGVFSDEEAQSFVDRVARRALAEGKAAPEGGAAAAIEAAAKAVTKDQLMEAMLQRRMRIAAKVARDGRQAQLDAMPASMRPAEKLSAYNVGSEKVGEGLARSVDAAGRARQMGLWNSVEIGLRQRPGLFERVANPLGLRDRAMELKVAKEMARINGAGEVEPTGDEDALHAARVFSGALEQARTMQNDLGAWAPRQRGYIARQSHDALKVAGGMWRELAEGVRAAKESGGKFDWKAAKDEADARSFRAWRDNILPRLDPRTFEGLEKEDVPAAAEEGDETKSAAEVQAARAARARSLAERGVIDDPNDARELFLHNVWSDIVLGRHAELTGADDGADFRPKPSLARSISRARVLHFKTPEDWVAYNEDYGSRSVFSTVMNQLERAGRNAELLKRWGPAPEAAFDAEKTRLANEARDAGLATQARELDGWRVRSDFEHVNGRANAPQNIRLARVMATARSWEAMTKLGAIVLSKVTDLPISGAVAARAGAGFLHGYRWTVKGLAGLMSDDARAAAHAIGPGARAFAGELGGQFMATDGVPGWATWGNRMAYKVNGYTFLNERVRTGAAAGYSAFFGAQARNGWGMLNPGARETLERYGITNEDWAKARKGVEKAPDGESYFTLEHIADPELRLKFATMFHGLIDDVVSEPRAREHSIASFGTKPGTVMGEIARSFFQFKNFIATILLRHTIPAMRGYATVSPALAVAHLFLGTTLAGWLSMNAHLLAKGEAPKDLATADPGELARIWSASLAQGGGLGMYGDFLFGEQSRTGAAFDLAQMGGPLLSDADQVATVLQQAIHGGDVSEKTGRTPIEGEAVRLLSHNVPIINTFYSRLALDYGIFWRLQEAASPGYLQRYENRVRRQEGQDFIVPPTSALH